MKFDKYKKINQILEIHDNGYLPDKHDKIKAFVQCNHKVPYIELIQKHATELIARDVLNCSTVLMADYRPFKKPLSESHGESDNIGKNYSLDTKLLMLNELCYKISKDDSVYRQNNQVWEFFFDIYSTYAKMNKIINFKKFNKFEKNQIQIINELKKKLLRFRNKKNLLFLFPIPQCDFLFTVYNKKSSQNTRYDFGNSYMSIFVEVLSFLKKDTNFTEDLYFAYCLYDGTYNLIKVEEDGYISEAFIPVNKQNDFLEPLYVGIKDSKGLHRFRVDRNPNTNHLITKHSY
ncbi:hypothetical protein [uncultured Dubosiella sp.]|uniref:hypothetical protein n=1 Tax=uncultured Dubosiella sp. TaxID=1937011 RepID=UPI002732085D|nr:hypothetical protein [uncultured Dubosiella sp.]